LPWSRLIVATQLFRHPPPRSARAFLSHSCTPAPPFAVVTTASGLLRAMPGTFGLGRGFRLFRPLRLALLYRGGLRSSAPGDELLNRITELWESCWGHG
jgi:hypothetical protein